MGPRRLALIAAMSGAVIAACGQAGVGPALRPPAALFETSLPSLRVAMAESRDLGPIATSQIIHFELTLRGRDDATLQQLLATHRSVSAQQYATEFGPDPSAVSSLRRLLGAHHLSSSWTPGDVSMQVSGRAGDVEALLSVRLHLFVKRSGASFYAPLDAPSLRALQPEAIAVTQLDDYREQDLAAIPASDQYGVTPAEMSSFYDLTPLRDAGLDGSGITVVVMDFAVPPENVLQAYAQKFTPSQPFNMQVQTDAADWGAPSQPGDQQYAEDEGEASMDVEIIHGIAPGARIELYGLGDAGSIPQVVQAAAKQFPGAIVSSSIGATSCEADSDAQQVETAEDQAYQAASAQGMSIFVAAGDRGAFSCLDAYPQDQQATTQLSVTADSCGDVTSVGGTYVEFGQGNSYFQEAAWGEPTEQWGGAGGTCQYTAHESWQSAPGVPASAQRLIPDVSAEADVVSGWDIFAPDPQDTSQVAETTSGGTSAAAPFWAAVTALIDQDLTQKHLPLVGFANPALYLFARSPSGLPAPAFHDVTLGSNLHYTAGPGWDFATGLGTPDGAALADDFEWYGRTGGRS